MGACAPPCTDVYPHHLHVCAYVSLQVPVHVSGVAVLGGVRVSVSTRSSTWVSIRRYSYRRGCLGAAMATGVCMYTHLYAFIYVCVQCVCVHVCIYVYVCKL